MAVLDTAEARLALALILGLLLGVERERRNKQRDYASIAGLRTFGIVGLIGGLARYLHVPYAIGVGAAVVGGLIIVGYALDPNRERDRGVTTEVALLLTYFLGVLAIDRPAIAGTVTIITAVLLYLRGSLHTFVSAVLREDEVRDGLMMLVFAFVVLPLAPDVNVGPYRAINLQVLARLMLVVTLISAMGYVMQRVFGARWGLVASGLGSGFVSSTATVAAFGLRAKQEHAIVRAAAAGAAASSIATVLQYGAIVAAIDRALLSRLAYPLGFALAAAVLGTGALAYQASAATQPADAPKGRAFQPLPPLVVGLASAVVSVLAAAFADEIGDAGIVLVSSLAGLVDAHATTASIATLHRSAAIESSLAIVALAAALTTNTLTKIVMAMVAGPRAYATRVAGAVGLIASAAWLGIWIGR